MVASQRIDKIHQASYDTQDPSWKLSGQSGKIKVSIGILSNQGT